MKEKKKRKCEVFFFLLPLLSKKKKEEKRIGRKHCLFQPEILLKENYREMSLVFLLLSYYERKEEREDRGFPSLPPLSRERGFQEGGGI